MLSFKLRDEEDKSSCSRACVEDHSHDLLVVDLSHLYLDVLEEVVVPGDELEGGHPLHEAPHRHRLLPALVHPEGLEAMVDQVGHVLRLEVLLGLVGVHDEVPTTVVPVNRS